MPSDTGFTIEIDGDGHAASDQAAYDSARTAWLEECDYKVIRFHASEVERELGGVLEAIRAACETRSRREGRGRIPG